VSNTTRDLIEELPHASTQRVEEILTFLEDVLSAVPCKLPTEEDSDEAYECQNIPRTKEIMLLVRKMTAEDGEVDNIKGKTKAISALSTELISHFSQIHSELA